MLKQSLFFPAGGAPILLQAFRNLREKPLYVKLSQWEFWPFQLLYFPVYFYYLWLSIKARSFFFFTAANPSIEFGGMLGESKWDILNQIPTEYIPRTKQFPPHVAVSDVLEWMEAHKLRYPIIFKPDIGERGWMVKKINGEEDIHKYLLINTVNFLAQEYVSLPVELGVFYYRFPGEERGKISSVTKKVMMEVTGNGRDSVKVLLLRNRRARLYIKAFEEKYPQKLSLVPAKGERVEVEPIGNHCRGTTFLDETSRVTDKLEMAFDLVANQIPGFYFGRFDIRCSSFEVLEAGRDFKILELNGAGAEPGHIYHPGRSIWSGYKDIIHHLNVLFSIAVQNHRLGIPYMHFRPGLRFIWMIRKYNRKKRN